MSKTLHLNYLENGRVYNENRVYSYDNENLGTNIIVEVPSYYEDFTFVMDCQNGTITKQIELGTGSTTYSLSIDDSLTLTGTLELQLWATILSGTETVKVQWEKYNLTINDALNISTVTAEANPDIIATHTAQIADLYNITSILDTTGDGTKFLSDDGTYKAGGSGGTTDYTQLTNKPSINSVTLSGNKTSAELGLQPAGSYITVETDPTVPAWAKSPTKPTYTASEVGSLALTGGTLTGDLNFTSAGINDINYVDFDVLATSGAKVARMRWNNTDRCLEYDSFVDGTIVTNQIGQELWVRVRNNTGSIISNGKAVRITGATGNRPTIALAQANSEANCQNYIGLTTEDINANDDGFVTLVGSVRGIDTGAYTIGNPLYISSTTAGNLTQTIPTAPNCKIRVGFPTVGGGSGEILVLSESFPTISKLSDVSVSSIANNDILKWDSIDSRWENSTTDIYKTYAGFVNRTDSTITINASGVVTLAPAVTSFTVYTMGTKHVLTNTQTVTVTSDQTITYIYLDSAGVLQKTITSWDLTSGLNIPVAICFKDGSTYALTDERHGHERNKAWHNWAHNNIGAMYKSGLTGTFTTSTLSITQGIIYDEDLQADTGGTKTTCSLWYRNATTGMRLIRGSNYAKAVSGGGILQYDDGSGTLHDVTNNRYATNWVYATNDPTEPIYCVIGQGDYSNLTNARNASAPTINLSTAEWKLIYRVIFQRTAGVPAGNYIESADFRTVQTGVATSASTTDHNSLINRDSTNSHPSSAISYDNGGDVLTNVQTELDGRLNKSYVVTIATGDWSTDTYTQTITGLTDADFVDIWASTDTDEGYIDTWGITWTQSGTTITFTKTGSASTTLSLNMAIIKCTDGGTL